MREQRSEMLISTAAEGWLVDDDQTDGTTPGLSGPNTQRLRQAARAQRVVANLPQRRTEKGARPVIGDDDEHARGKSS